MIRQQGSLIIEVMVSTLIGTLLLYGALSILLSSKEMFIVSQGLSRVEERGRLALEILAEDIRMSGYRGCVSSGSQPVISTVSGNADWGLQPDTGIRGWEYSGTTYGTGMSLYNPSETTFSSASWTGGVNFFKGTTVDMLQNSDALQLWVAQPYPIDITGTTLNSSDAYFSVASMNGLPADDDSDPDRFMLVSDCSRNLLVQTSQFQHTDREIHLDSTRFNGEQAQLTTLSQPQGLLLEGVLYYLAIPSHSDRPSLYRKVVDIGGSFDGSASNNFENAVEVLPGVLNLQFQYGVNTNNQRSADTYLDADKVTDWSQVVSVRVFMLVETEADRTSPQGQSTYYFGHDYAAASATDKRIRREFSTTVTLRNRALGLTTVGNTTSSTPATP